MTFILYPFSLGFPRFIGDTACCRCQRFLFLRQGRDKGLYQIIIFGIKANTTTRLFLAFLRLKTRKSKANCLQLCTMLFVDIVLIAKDIFYIRFDIVNLML